MTRYEWISALNKAQALADEGNNRTCTELFGFLRDAIEALPVFYPRDEETEEEEEEE